MIDKIEVIDYNLSKEFVQKHHYSKVMPRITKLCIGGFQDNKLVAVATLGYGVRPLHTIKKIFPILDVKDYLEIGKLCVIDEMPKNTESYFISRMIKRLKEEKSELSILYSWADGIISKPGYCYQASNFYYGGFIKTEMYLDKDGRRVHARTMQGLSTGPRMGKMKSRAYNITKEMGYTKYFGYQFRYIYPLCREKEWQKIKESSPFIWERKNYPKDKDCKWWVQIEKGKRISCGKPNFVITEYIK